MSLDLYSCLALAEMLEKVLAYNITQIIRLRKKLSERQETECRGASLRNAIGPDRPPPCTRRWLRQHECCHSGIRLK